MPLRSIMRPKPSVGGGRGEGSERVELPDSLGGKTPVYQSGGAGPEAANRLPDGRRLEGLEGWLGSRTRLVALWVRQVLRCKASVDSVIDPPKEA